jgi:hypothetical protein
MAEPRGFLERPIGEDVEELKKELKRLRDLNEKATSYEFGSGAGRVRAVRQGSDWRVLDVYGSCLTKAGKFSPSQTATASVDWSKDDALKEAQQRARSD